MGSCVSFTKDGVIRLAAIRLDSIFLNGKGMKLVEEANRKIAYLPNYCRNDAYRRRTETLVNEDKSFGELFVNKLYNVDKKAEQLLDSSNHIDRSVSSINIQTQELAQTSKNVQERVNDVLDQSLKTSDSQMELQNSQTKMNGRLDVGMTTLDESTNNLGKEMINLKNKAVKIEKEIVQAAEAVLKRMDGLQNKADDIKNKLDKQKQLVRSQTIALEVLQNTQEENI
nr:protein gamete expressed 1-like isoform X2 [Tanacetum cinerariifolium]